MTEAGRDALDWSIPADVPEGRCGFTVNYPDIPELPGEVTCWRGSWRDHDRCIWHADVGKKSAHELAGVRTTTWERLEGAVLREVHIEDTISFADCSLRFADLSDASLPNADLSDASFLSTDLSGVDLMGANLSGATLIDADLSKAFLPWTDFSNAILGGADLSDADLVGGDLSDANFREADLSDADLEIADLSDAVLVDAVLSDANLGGANLSEAYLGGADLSNASLLSAILSNASLPGADLSNAALPRADLTDANLVNVGLQNARLTNTTLTKANLERANLTCTDLFDADLRGAEFYGAVIDNVQLNTNTKFGNHYPDDVEKATWTLAQIEELSRQNALPGQVREAFTKRKDRRRHHYWYHSNVPGWLRWPVTRLKAAGNELTTRLVAGLRAWVNDDTRTEADTADEDTGSDDAPTSEAETTDEPAVDPPAEDSTTDNAGPEDLTNWQRWENTGRWAWLALTGATTRYGESPRRVVATSLAVILGFGVVYPFVGGIETTTAETEAFRLADWLSLPVGDGTARIVFENLYFSAVTFTTLGYGDIQPGSDTTKLLASIESLLGALLMALLVAVLARRITR